jgi:pimeloyl-ACP methyl ester carboxylesterase
VTSSESRPLPDWIESQLPAGARHQIVDVGDGQRMHVTEWGPPAGRAVLLVHGNPTWSFLWRKVVTEIRARAGGEELRFVAPDLIGLGRSSRPSAEMHTLGNHQRWVGTMVDRVIGAQPLVLVAQDWGGSMGLGALAPRKAQLRGIVLGNTAVGPPRKGFKPTMFHRLSQLPVVSTILFRDLGFPLGVLHMSQGDRSSIRGDVARAYRWPLASRAERVAPLALARMVPDAPTGHPSVPALELSDELFRTAQVPISLVWGTKDPVLGRVINHLERQRPDAKVVRTDRAGHFLQEEVPELLADAVMDVVARASWS